MTLVGPGVGKTRLALELAERLAATTPDVVLLELELSLTASDRALERAVSVPCVMLV